MLSGFLKIKSEKRGLVPTPTFQINFQFIKTNKYTFQINFQFIKTNEYYFTPLFQNTRTFYEDHFYLLQFLYQVEK